MPLQRKAFLDWRRFCSHMAIFSSTCCTSLKEILQIILLLHSLHRHVALVYSKTKVLHCFKQYSALFTKILHNFKTFWKSHSTLFEAKQDFHRLVVLFERTCCKSWCCTCFKTAKHFFQKLLCIISGICSRLLLHVLTGVQALNGRLTVRVHSLQNNAVVI